MQVDRPVVFLAHAHSSKKKRGIQEVRTFDQDLTLRLHDSACSILREGHQGAPWGADVLRDNQQGIMGIHLLATIQDHTDWWLNDFGGRQWLLDWDAMNLAGADNLRWVWIQGEHHPEFAEKFLFAGAPVVVSGPAELALDWYEYLSNGYSLIEAWELAGQDYPVHIIPSDPFDYWDWKESRKQDQPGPALIILSSDQEVLHFVPAKEGYASEEKEDQAVAEQEEAPVFLTEEFVPEIVTESEPEPEPAEPEVAPERVFEAEVVPDEVESIVVSGEYDRLPRELDAARREELEYRHPQRDTGSNPHALVVAEESWEKWEVSEERIIEIINKEEVKFAPRRRILATVISACLGLALLTVGLWEMGMKVSHEQIDRLAHFSTFSDSAGFRVLLLPFHRSEGCSPSQIWDETAVRDHLLSRPEAADLGLEVSYITPGSCPDRQEDARRLAEIYNADLVVWGLEPEGNDSLLTLSYVLEEGASDLDLRHLIAHHRLADGNLGGSTEAVVDQVLALGFFAHQNPREALTFLDQALTVPSPVAAWRELAIVLSLEGLHQPEQALKRCETALDTFINHESLAFHADRLRSILYPDNSTGATPTAGMAPMGPGIAAR